MFTLAFAMIGSFAFANNSTINEKQLESLDNEKSLDFKTSKKIAFATFKEMVSSGTLNIVSFEELDKSFLFIDDFGNEWIVEFDSMYYIPFTAFLTASEIIYEVTVC